MEKKSFKKLFPHISEEIELGASKLDLSSIEDHDQHDHPEMKQSKPKRKYSEYTPKAEDFIRRCKKSNQAEEIITYMEQTKTLSPTEAERLRKQLREEGLRSFGSYKEPGFYEK